jgi:putative alpha-1,2-mannosidase
LQSALRFAAMGAAALAAVIASPAFSAPALATTSGFADVDPFIGTGPDGHTFPGAVMPFGMVQPSPDTLIADFKHSYTHAAGYRFGDPTIQGFSQTHFSGTGHSDLGDFELMPIAGEAKLDPGAPDQPGSGYRSRYSHDSEKAEPGYYAMTLSD